MAPHLFVEPVALAGVDALRRTWESISLAARLARQHRDAPGMFHGWADTWLDPRFADWSIEAEVARIGCPVLAIQGVDDQYGTLRQIHRIAELCPSTSLVELADCRHSPHLDQPQATLDAIVRFVRGARTVA